MHVRLLKPVACRCTLLRRWADRSRMPLRASQHAARAGWQTDMRTRSFCVCAMSTPASDRRREEAPELRHEPSIPNPLTLRAGTGLRRHPGPNRRRQQRRRRCGSSRQRWHTAIACSGRDSTSRLRAASSSRSSVRTAAERRACSRSCWARRRSRPDGADRRVRPFAAATRTWATSLSIAASMPMSPYGHAISSVSGSTATGGASAGRAEAVEPASTSCSARCRRRRTPMCRSVSCRVASSSGSASPRRCRPIRSCCSATSRCCRSTSVHQQMVVDLIDRRRREHDTAVLFVTHEINPVLRLVDRVLYIIDGKFRLGPPDEVMTSEVLSELYGTDIEVIRRRRPPRRPRRVEYGVAAPRGRPTPTFGASAVNALASVSWHDIFNFNGLRRTTAPRTQLDHRGRRARPARRRRRVSS